MKKFKKEARRLMAKYGLDPKKWDVVPRERGDITTVATGDEAGRLVLALDPSDKEDWADTAAQAVLAEKDPRLVLHRGCEKDPRSLEALKAFAAAVDPVTKAWACRIIREVDPDEYRADLARFRAAMAVFSSGHVPAAAVGGWLTLAAVLLEAGDEIEVAVLDPNSAAYLEALRQVVKEEPEVGKYVELCLMAELPFIPEYHGECLRFHWRT